MYRICKAAAVVLCLLFIFSAIPAAVLADTEPKVVRVGWFESDFNLTDKLGRRSGYAYEYQQKISAYTGWKYEYVTGSWPQLYQMLLDGRIDLLSDVSYTEERAGKMLFSSLPMGSETYYVCISTKIDSHVSEEDVLTLNGKRIGVNANSIQENILNDWLKKNGIQAEIVELSVDQTGSVAMLDNGEIDAFVNVEAYGLDTKIIPLFMIGSSDFYFAVNKDRSDLLTELNSALVRIQEENKYYNLQLEEKYFSMTYASPFFTQGEVSWLTEHGAVRVGYVDGFLAFCGKDGTTGELTGALKDYLELSSKCMHNYEIEFEPVAYPSLEEALKALENGDIDCMFPVELSDYDAEEMGVLITGQQMETEVYAAVRTADRRDFSLDSEMTVALVTGDFNYRAFLLGNFPNWKYAFFDDARSAFAAVADGAADCVLVCNYRLNWVSDLIDSNSLTTVDTGCSMEFSFAVRRSDDHLYSIMNKTGHFIPDSAIHSSLTSYSYVEKKLSFADFLRANYIEVFIVLSIVLAIIFLLFLHSRRSERKAKESLMALEESLGREAKQKEELSDVRDKAYSDPLTGVKSKHAYVEASELIQRRIDSGEAYEFAVAVFDVNDLKLVNDISGHDAGDLYLLEARKLICDTFKHSPIFRIGGDEFTAILTGEDFENRAELMELFNKKVEENKSNGRVVVAVGLAEHDPTNDVLFVDVFRRADERMYTRKRELKGN